MSAPTKIVNGVQVELSPEEIATRLAEEAEWVAGQKMRSINRIEESCGMPRWQRDLVIAALPIGHPQRTKAEIAEKAIAPLRA